MATQLVLLSETAADAAHLKQVAMDMLPEGALISYRDGQLTQFVHPSGRSLLTVFTAKPIEDPREAQAALADPPASFSLWTEMLVPFGDDGQGRALAEAIAQAIGGTVKERKK